MTAVCNNQSAYGGLDIDDAWKRQVTQLLQIVWCCVAEAAATPRQLRDLAVQRVVNVEVALRAPIVAGGRHQAVPLSLSRSLLRTLLYRGQLQLKLGFYLARCSAHAARIHCRDADVNIDIWAWDMWEYLRERYSLQDSAALPEVLTNAVMDLATARERAW